MVDFLVIGPMGAATYKEFFPLIRDGIVRLGSSRVGEFSDGSKFGNTIWFSTMSDYCPPELKLKKQYNEDDYHRFDNYDAINVNRTNDIPCDYYGVIGVPITFLEKWNPSQFDLLGMLTDNPADNIYTFNGIPIYTDERHHKSKCGVMDGRRCYNKLLIRRKCS